MGLVLKNRNEEDKSDFAFLMISLLDIMRKYLNIILAVKLCLLCHMCFQLSVGAFDCSFLWKKVCPFHTSSIPLWSLLRIFCCFYGKGLEYFCNFSSKSRQILKQSPNGSLEDIIHLRPDETQSQELSRTTPGSTLNIKDIYSTGAAGVVVFFPPPAGERGKKYLFC